MEYITSVIKNVVKKVVRTVIEHRPILPFGKSDPLEDIIVHSYYECGV